MIKQSFENKVVVITGGASGIGKATAQAFEKEGARVCIIDLKENPYFVGDIAEKTHLDQFVKKVIDEYGKIDYLINNAMPLFKGIEECSYEDFNRSLCIGISAPFYLAQSFLPYFNEGASIINISSTRDRMSQPQSESYSAAKGGISALTHSLAMSLAGKVRVNSISPGWIDTLNQNYKGPDASQQPVGRVGKPEDITELILFLCSDAASFITAENICVDGGMTKQMIYSGEFGWNYQE